VAGALGFDYYFISMKIALFGCGKIGTAIATLLKSLKIETFLFDKNIEQAKYLGELLGFRYEKLDLDKFSQTPPKILRQVDCLICALPFSVTFRCAELAADLGLNYADLTEDIETSEKIRKLPVKKNFFLTQCGLAPGLISVFAKKIYSQFQKLEEVKLRVGALPLYPSNALKYNITWSTEGLINEYLQDCIVIKDGKIKTVPALEDLETIIIDGATYEAFNTSGGLGTLHKTLEGKVENLNYKTIRHLNHCHYIKFLLNDLKLRQKPDLLVDILESALPTTPQDKCIVYVEVKGVKDRKYQQLTFSRTVYHRTVAKKDFSAIQLCTAAGVIAPVLIALKQNLRGSLRVEDLNQEEVLNTKVVKQIFNA